MRWYIIAICVMMLGCAGSPAGKQIDDWCVAGKLEESSAKWLNRHQGKWNQHGDYTQELKKDDRIVNSDCSEYLINLAKWDFRAAYASYKKLIGADDPRDEDQKKSPPGLKRRRGKE
jgi:hypothetical protein